MCSWREPWRALALALTLGAAASLQAQPRKSDATAYPGIGRPATPKELAAWDIDVRPDFKGLPAGSGSVAQGMVLWENQCASCHGVFGENNEVFSPIVGGTTADDQRSGRVARLTDRTFPSRTTLMKLPTLSTLWDYINRAMPWNQPKSLSPDQVYAVTAYILNLGGVLPDDATLSNQNIAEVQQRLPNRNGMTTDHALWPGAASARREPDVAAVACMKDCAGEPSVASSLPVFARNAHGNLAEQNRSVGSQRGINTAASTPGALPVASGSAAQPSASALMQQFSCTACHGLDKRILGPGFREVAKKYAGRIDAAAYLSARIQAGGAGVWGDVAMPPQGLSDAEARVIAQWLTDGAP